MAKKALGKGIGAIFTDDVMLPDGSYENEILFLNIADISPNRFQPRKIFDSEELATLSESIKEKGVLQPVIVREISVQTSSQTSSGGTAYELVAGERRWRASGMAGKTTIPAVVRKIDDNELLEIALIENIQRKDLNPLEKAEAFSKLSVDLDLTQEEIARRVGMDRSTVANFMRILTLPAEVKDMLVCGKISMGHAKLFLSLKDQTKLLQLAEKTAETGISVNLLSEYIKKANELFDAQESEGQPEKPGKLYIPEEDSLQRKLDARVKISGGEGKGKIIITYTSKSDFERLLNILTR